MKLEWKQVLAALLIGCLAGGVLGSRMQRRSFHKFWQQGPRTERILKKFTRELNLDAPQREQVKVLLEKNREKIKALHQESSGKFDQVRTDMRAEIRKILNVEQQKKFDEKAARWDARRKRFKENGVRL